MCGRKTTSDCLALGLLCLLCPLLGFVEISGTLATVHRPQCGYWKA